MFAQYQQLVDSPFFQLVLQQYHFVYYTAFIWGPVLFVWLAQHLWLEYVRMKFIRKNYEFVMLEIKLPRIIEKTPIAMELVLASLYQAKTGDWFETWWEGYVKPWFSLEIVSFEGHVKFYIRTPAKFKKLIESHVYAQYPDIEVHEVPDYISLAPYIHEKDDWTMWGTEYKLTMPDPYPIKTYVDYGLDSTMVKEENKSDPITSLIEFMGSIGRGQQMWIQILVQATTERFKTPGTWFQHHDWKTEGKRVIKALQEKYSGEFGFFKATKRESEVVHAIERSLGKPGFDTGIRSIYIAKKEFFDSTNISGIVDAFSQYNSFDLNGFRSVNKTVMDFPWSDFRNIRLSRKKKKMFNAYVRRSYFYAPYKKKPFVLNAEELATIYHFPGGVAETPTFTRIESRKGEPPPNLPI